MLTMCTAGVIFSFVSYCLLNASNWIVSWQQLDVFI